MVVILAAKMNGEAAINVTGNGEGTVFECNTAANIVDCGAGDDVVNSFLGDDTVYGRRGADYILASGGNDTVYGGNDADTIRGQSGADQLYGEQGDDKFKYNSTAESLNTALGRDFIHDFDLNGNDIIDIGYIDAKLSTSIGDSFAFIGTSAFTAEGQIRIESIGQSTMVEINNGGSLAADMSIYLKGTAIGLVDATDFIL